MPADSTTAATPSAESACQSGQEFLSRGDLAAASTAFETAIALDPSMAQAHLGLGNSLRRQLQYRAAESALRRAYTLEPVLRETVFSLAFLLHGAGRDNEAGTALSALAAREPADLTLQRQIAGLLMDFGCFEAAAVLARKIAEATQTAGAWQRLGVCLLQLLRLPEAEEALNAAVHAEPLAGFAYLLMSQTRRATTADRTRLTELRGILDSGRIAGDARACLHFALGNWFEDLGDYAGAWAQFSAGNRLRHEARPFDRAAWEDYFKRMLNTAVRLDRSPALGQRPQPLFLVGLPGANPEPLASLLVTHPAVSDLGAGTQVDGLARACEQLADGNYPECLPTIEGAQLDGLEQGARSDWPEKSKDARWVLDQSPLNFLHLALIVRVLPGARIIYPHRHPIDDCFSAHLCPFADSLHNHAHDLQDLAFFHRQFAALMKHWKQALPADTLMEFATNQMLEGSALTTDVVWKFLELETPPAMAVRPSAARSVFAGDPQRRDIPGRWRNYREHLAPVLEAAGLEPE